MIASDIARAAAVAADLAKDRWASLRIKIIRVPGRIAATGRRLVLHLPTHWPWADRGDNLHASEDLTTQPEPAPRPASGTPEPPAPVQVALLN